MLTTQQIHFFETFGFLVIREAFSREEIDAITHEADALWADARDEAADVSHQNVGSFIEQSASLSALAENDRLYGAMTQLLGAGFIWGGSEGNKGVWNPKREHQWHADRGEEFALQYRRIKVMLYLERTSRDTGALRVVPGSHRSPLNEAMYPLNQQQHLPDACQQLFGVAGNELPCYAFESNPGDLIMFDQYLYHAVYGMFSTRRYIALKYVAAPVTPEHVASLVHHHQDAARLHPAFRESTRPRIREMVGPLVASAT